MTIAEREVELYSNSDRYFIITIRNGRPGEIDQVVYVDGVERPDLNKVISEKRERHTYHTLATEIRRAEDEN